MVIQRWQSLYLLVAAIIMAVFSFLPIAEFGTADADYVLSTMNLSVSGTPADANIQASSPAYLWGVFAVAMLISLLSIIAIFQFKNLKLQRKMCVLCICLTLAFVVSLVVVIMRLIDILDCNEGEIFKSSIMPFVSVVLYCLAYLGIKKDMKILSSYDRIR